MALGGTLAVGDVTIAYEVTGSPADPALLLLHGITDSLHTYDAVAPTLAADGYRVFAIDHRGHGRSSPASSYDLHDYAADAVAVIYELIGEAPVIVGHSLGGLVALYIAARYPDRCRGVVLEDPPLFIAEAIDGTIFQLWFSYLREFLVDHRRRGGELGEIIDLVREADPTASERQLRAYCEGLTLLSVEVLTPPLEDRGLDDFVSERDLPAIAQPILLLSGVYDLGGAMRPGEPERLVAAVAGAADHAHFDDVGHMIHQARPDRYLAEVRAFARSLG
jgi:pimeloyl-ACP methyl ester carboxylesterase